MQQLGLKQERTADRTQLANFPDCFETRAPVLILNLVIMNFIERIICVVVSKVFVYEAQKFCREPYNNSCTSSSDNREIIHIIYVYVHCTYHLHVPIVKKSGGLNLLERCGPVQACNGTALPLPLYVHCRPL